MGSTESSDRRGHGDGSWWMRGRVAAGRLTGAWCAPEMPATVRADQIVGRWGVASYQDPKDRTRVEAAAKAQCKLPYVITAGAWVAW